MPVDAVKRFGEVAGQGFCGGDGAGAGAEGCYGSSMGDDWRVRIALVDLPRELTDDDQVYARGYPASPQEIAAAAAVHAEMESYRQALIPELGSRLGDQVAVGSSGTDIFLYAPSAGSADEAARAAREVLAQMTSARPYESSAGARGTRSGWMRRTSRPPMSLPSSRLSTNTFRSTSGKHRSRPAVPPGRFGSNCHHTAMR